MANPVDDHTQIALLKQLLDQTVHSQNKQSEVMENLSNSISELVGEMKKRDVLDELIKARLDTVETELDNHIKTTMPVLMRSSLYQGWIDKMIESIFSKIGVIVLMLIAAGLAYQFYPNGIKPPSASVEIKR